MYIIVLHYCGLVRSKEKSSLYEAVKVFESMRQNYPGARVTLEWRCVV